MNLPVGLPSAYERPDQLLSNQIGTLEQGIVALAEKLGADPHMLAAGIVGLGLKIDPSFASEYSAALGREAWEAGRKIDGQRFKAEGLRVGETVLPTVVRRIPETVQEEAPEASWSPSFVEDSPIKDKAA